MSNADSSDLNLTETPSMDQFVAEFEAMQAAREKEWKEAPENQRTEDYTLILAPSEISTIERFERRTGVDIRDWIGELLYQDWGDLRPCVWDEDAMFCDECEDAEECPDRLEVDNDE
jgi:hypothetical protein